VTPANDEQTLELVPVDPALPEAEGQVPEAEEIDADPPAWVQQASLSELLLWRLGIPIDREQMEREQQKAKDTFDLKPPITTRKVADAIAHLSMQLMRGELDATSAKTTLYALQTLLTALRLQIVEEKKPKPTTRKKKNRRPRNAKRSRQR
jgi:hypothetical protein